jgi:hypothetical protein
MQTREFKISELSSVWKFLFIQHTGERRAQKHPIFTLLALNNVNRTRALKRYV